MNKKSIRLNIAGFTAAEQQRIEAALAFATKAHEGQFRKSGDPYIIHPIAVAANLIEFQMDVESVMAGLLHDTMEDTGVTLEALASLFGSDVAALVDGVTKVGEVDRIPLDGNTARAQASAENIRKLLLAMAKDVRVIIVKMADRLHNLTTLQYLARDKQLRIARESLEIYSPLADRLGMGALKVRLEDLSFKFLNPEEYERLHGLMAGYGRTTGRYLNRLRKHVATQLEAAGIEVLGVEGRQKHLYSIYRKLQKTGGDLDKLYDLIALRVIVRSESECYKALGILHQEFKPLIYRIKDYIAVPKPNGYRSLHTTVWALDGRITEFQIRTPQMHEEAERGLAAHYHYNMHKGSTDYQARAGAGVVPKKLRWVSELATVGDATGTGKEFVETMRVDLFRDRIFVFSPKGDLYDLPEGATPIDFAFTVHSGLGLRMLGAKVNGRIVSLDTKLANRDMVEVLTRKVAAPNRDWLEYVQTNVAKSAIRSWFRALSREANMASGRQALEAELADYEIRHLDELGPDALARLVEGFHLQDSDSLLAAIGEGTVLAATVVRRMFPAEVVPSDLTAGLDDARPAALAATERVVFEGKVDLPYTLGACCQPVYPQPLVGYITRGKGITVHRQGCGNIPGDRKRLIVCRWESLPGEAKIYLLSIVAANRIGLLRDTTAVFSSERINIIGIHSRDNVDHSEATIEVQAEIHSLDELSSLVGKLRRLPDVLTVKRQLAPPA